MAVLTNTMLQGTSAVSADADGYQIKKSLRIDNGHLEMSTKMAGDRRKFTISFWIKNCADGKRWFSTGYSTTDSSLREGYLGFNSGQLTINHSNGSGGTAVCDLRTKRVFRDPSAWYHICIAVDTNPTTQAERVKLWINGELNTAWAASTYPQQHTTFGYMQGVNKELTLGCWRLNGNLAGYHDGYFADWFYIDGLHLSPSTFGSFDTLGIWNPKSPYNDDGDFALPAPNVNKTWSSVGAWTKVSDGSTMSFHSNGALTNGFDESLTSGVYPASNSDYVDMQWIISSSADQPTLTHSLRLYASFTNYMRTIEVHTDAGVAYTYITGVSSGWSTAAWQDLNVPKGSTKLQKLVLPVKILLPVLLIKKVQVKNQ